MVQEDEGAGDHVLGQAGGRPGAQDVRVDRCGRGGAGTGAAGGGDAAGQGAVGRALGGGNTAGRALGVDGHDVRGQAPVAGGVLPYGDHRVGHARVAGQRRLDLAGFDAEAAHLDLSVGAAEVFEDAVGCPARPVAGPVHARARRAAGAGHPGVAAGAGGRAAARVGEGVGDETLRGERGPAEVAAGDLVTGQVQLARYPGRHGVEGGVEHVRLHVASRPSDDGLFPLAGDAAVHGVDGALGRPVVVVRGGAGQGAQRLPEGGVDGFAAHHEDAGPVPFAGEQSGGDQLVQVGGGEVEEVDAVVGDVVDEGGRVEAYGVLDEVELVAGGQEQRALPGGVEGERGGQRGPQAAPGGGRLRIDQLGPVVEEQVRQLAVFHDDALGLPGGAGGVADVRRVAGCQRGHPVGVRGVGVRAEVQFPCGGRGVQAQGGGGAGQVPGGRRRGEDADRAGVGEQEADALGGQLRVDRYGRGARLEDGQQAREVVGGARQGQRHERLGPGAAFDQRVCQPVGAGVQRGVREGGGAAHEGGGRGRAAGLLLEERGQRGDRHGAGGVVPSGGHPAALGGGQQVDAADGLFGVDAGQGVQQGQEAALVGGGDVGVVEVRVGLEVDAQAAVVGPLVDVDAEAGDRAVGEVVQGGRVPSEGQLRVVAHDVDAPVAERAAGVRGAQLLDEVRRRVALVAQQAAGPLGGVPQQFAHGRVRLQPDLERQHVGDHARRAARYGADAAGHGQVQRHVGRSAHAVHVQRECGHRHHGQPRPGLPGQGAQPVGGGRGEVAGLAHEAVRDGGQPAGETRSGGAAGEALGPERAVLGAPFGGVVLGLVGQQLLQGAQVAGRALLARLQGAVDLGDPPDHEREAVTVQDDVVQRHVQHAVVAGQQQHGEAEQRGAAQVGGLAQVGPHPFLGAGPGVGRRDHQGRSRRRSGGAVRRLPQVDDGQRPVVREVGDLPDAAVLVGLEPDPYGVDAGHGAAHRGVQHGQVDRAVDVHVLRGTVDRVLRVQLLGEPHPRLRDGQRQSATAVAWLPVHACRLLTKVLVYNGDRAVAGPGDRSRLTRRKGPTSTTRRVYRFVGKSLWTGVRRRVRRLRRGPSGEPLTRSSQAERRGWGRAVPGAGRLPGDRPGSHAYVEYVRQNRPPGSLTGAYGPGAHQVRRVGVRAAHDDAHPLPRRGPVRPGPEGGEGGRRAVLDRQPAVVPQAPARGHDRLVRDQQRDRLRPQGPVQRHPAGAAGTQRVGGDGVHRDVDDPARLDRRVQRPAVLRLDGHDLYAVVVRGRGDPAEQATAADRDDDRVQAGQRGPDLLQQGAGPGGDQRVVVRVRLQRAAPRGVFPGRLQRGGVLGAHLAYVGAEQAQPGDLDRRRGLGQEHRRPDAVAARRPGRRPVRRCPRRR